MASGEEAAELGDADSGLMWKPHNIEVTANIIINIINFNNKLQPEMQNAQIIQICSFYLFFVGSNFRCFCANSMRFTLIFGVYLLI